MRKVRIIRKTLIPYDHKTHMGARWEETESEAFFHDFAMDYDELQNGIALYPVAIVEHPDGTVEAVPLAGYTRIQFLYTQEVNPT